MKQLLHTIPETVKILGISRTLVYSLIAHGELDRVKLRNRAMITRGSIDRLIEVKRTS
jgi:predicted DNA-binding transcriptional regulator AlpA